MSEIKKKTVLSPEEVTEDKKKYTRKISTPIYEPKKERPVLSDIYITTKRDELIEEIDTDEDLKGDINADLRDFLKSAAERHVVFNFSKIADYYAHLPPKYKTFFEQSGLVIVDYDNAIRNSFVSYEKEVELTRLEYVNNQLTEEMQERRIDKLKNKQLKDEQAYLQEKEGRVHPKDLDDEEW